MKHYKATEKQLRKDRSRQYMKRWTADRAFKDQYRNADRNEAKTILREYLCNGREREYPPFRKMVGWYWW